MDITQQHTSFVLHNFVVRQFTGNWKLDVFKVTAHICLTDCWESFITFNLVYDLFQNATSDNQGVQLSAVQAAR